MDPQVPNPAPLILSTDFGQRLMELRKTIGDGVYLAKDDSGALDRAIVDYDDGNATANDSERVLSLHRGLNPCGLKRRRRKSKSVKASTLSCCG